MRLVQLESDDFAVVVRNASDGRLRHRYVGPDFMKAEEVFDQEVKRVTAPDVENPPT